MTPEEQKNALRSIARKANDEIKAKESYPLLSIAMRFHGRSSTAVCLWLNSLA